jgi:hypothetical protein
MFKGFTNLSFVLYVLLKLFSFFLPQLLGCFAKNAVHALMMAG